MCVTPTCIVGDFNIRYGAEARPLMQLLQILQLLIQFFTDPTQSAGHTLDFVITPKDDNFATYVDVIPMSI